MEIKYKRTYIPKGKRYTMGEMPAALGYAMEIIEPRPRLAEGKLNPGEMCMLLFALTPEEFALKDTDTKALDALAEKLCKNMPGDRLLAWMARDLKGTPVKSEIKPQIGESIDGGELAERVRERQVQALAGPVDRELKECRRLQQLCGKDAPEGVKEDLRAAKSALGTAISALERIYVAKDAILNNRWPAIGFDGRVEIFTTKVRGENALRQVHRACGDVALWTLEAVEGGDIEVFFKKLENDGLLELRVDNGFSAAEISLRDFREVRLSENAGLRAMMLREIAYGMRWNAFKQANVPEKSKVGALESMLSFRNFVHHTLGKGLVYAACDVQEGNGLLCTAAAAAKIPQNEGVQIVGGERCLTLKNKQDGNQMLAVFTTALQAVVFCEKLGSGARPVAMTFDDLVLRAKPCDGLVVDPEGFAYRLLKQDFDKVKEARSKPPALVRIQQKPEPESPPVKQEAESEMGSLPDPDAAELATIEKEKPVEPEKKEPEKKDEPPKGFFRRLFGK